jgi:hypothetical protein
VCSVEMVGQAPPYMLDSCSFGFAQDRFRRNDIVWDYLATKGDNWRRLFIISGIFSMV